MRRLAVLTGAGISAESGLPTYRGAGGLWRGRGLQELASPEAFAREPELVQAFYNQRRAQLAEVRPNAAHRALAALEARCEVTIVTQNVDDLHERAGSTRVVHLHGELTWGRSATDPECREHLGYRAIEPGELAADGGALRPAVVWFGEAVREWEAAEAAVAACDELWIVGTSLQVFPAAGLAGLAERAAVLRVVDPDAPVLADPRLRHHRGTAVEWVPRLVSDC